jgi:hypothetical protein
MGLFNNKEEFNELAVKTESNVNEIIAVKRDINHVSDEVRNISIESDERYKFLLDKLSSLEELYMSKLTVIDEERRVLINDYKNDVLQNDNKSEYSTCSDICKIIDIKNIKTASLKFYLHEKGIYNMSINKDRNSFSINNNNINNVREDLLKCIHISDNDVLFNRQFIEYSVINKDEILKSIQRYDNKQKQYKISKKNLESRNTKNYQNEINKICGTKDTYDGQKWGVLYKLFGEKFPLFEENYKKYTNEHDKDKEYKTTKIKYVVSEMCEGNYLLKIACDLYA